MMKGLSIIITCHNQAATIRRAVRSALDQHIPGRNEVEVIVIDDGSTDESAEIAEAAGAKVFSQENTGQAGARQAGLEHATMSHIKWLDGDDWLIPHKSALQLEAMGDAPFSWARQIVHVDDEEPFETALRLRLAPVTPNPRGSLWVNRGGPQIGTMIFDRNLKFPVWDERLNVKGSGIVPRFIYEFQKMNGEGFGWDELVMHYYGRSRREMEFGDAGVLYGIYDEG